MDLDKLKTSRYYPIVFTFLITFFFIFFLSFVYGFSKEKIAENKTLFIKKAVLQANRISFESDKAVASLYNERVVGMSTRTDDVYRVKDDEGKTNVTFLVSGNGLWGIITAAISFRQEGNRLVGIGIVSHSETPGLGGRIEEDWFMRQFQDEMISKEGIRSLAGSGTGNLDKEDGVVDAITGATLTSSLFNRIINDTIVRMRTLGAQANE